jgi:preprotein translocase subunit SecF
MTMNIIKNRYLYFLISLLVIIPGLIFLILNWTKTGTPLPLGIDFTGGSLLEVQFTGTRPSVDEIQDAFTKFAPEASPVMGNR